jgi:hypothetical protein
MGHASCDPIIPQVRLTRIGQPTLEDTDSSGRGVEHDTAATGLGCQLDLDLGDTEAVHDALGPGQVHAAGNVAMLGDEGVIRTVA